MKKLYFRCLLGLLCFAPPLALTAAAQNPIDEAKAQYEAAAYEEALSTLTRAEDTSSASRIEIEQYRALCLIALGKMTDAERAVAAIVEVDPTYVPSASIASPRVLAMVADIRKREIPGVVRRLLDSGRMAYQVKDLSRARQQFELMLKLLDDPAMAGRPEADDLRTLAQGFVTLATAGAVSAPSTAPSSGTAPPARVENPPSSGDRAATASADSPAGNGNPAAAPSPAGVDTSPAPSIVFVPAIAVEQPMPEWEPPRGLSATSQYTGSIKVLIGVDGKVKSAAIERRSHPAYDARLLQVAKTWLYKPATRNGVPVESEKLIAVSLRPR